MAVLKSCSALEAYCKLYVSQVAPWKVAEFLITHQRISALDSLLHRLARPRAPSHLRAWTKRVSRTKPNDFPAGCAPISITLRSARFLSSVCTNISTAIQERLVEMSNAMHATYCANTAVELSEAVAAARLGR